MNKITSKQIKCALMHYFRIKRGMVTGAEISVSEGRVADILADNESNVYEVEVKISKTDLNQDFKNKSDKHHIHKNNIDCKYKCKPNYFYICVPSELIGYTLPFIEKFHPQYGVIEYVDYSWWPDRIRIKKRAKRLHKKYHSRIQDIYRKLSYEILKLYILKADGKDKIKYSVNGD